MDSPALSFYRREDLDELLKDLKSDGMDVPPHDFDIGPGLADQHVDREPYTRTHLRVDVMGYEVITVGIVFSRPPLPSNH
jgi:hypothetical protein